MIQIDNLSFSYPNSKVEALSQISLNIPGGSILGLLGPNGAGKTTLISLLCGLLKAAPNTIKIDGQCLFQSAKKNSALLGYIPQEYAFYPNMSARENLNFFAGVQGLNGGQKQQRIDFSLDFCQLKNVENQRADTFSGGLKRRLNIAIGLLSDPQILLFDEPTVGIDPQSRAFILKQIQHLGKQGKTIIYTSHYMEEVEKICDHLAIIDGGQVLLQGELDQLRQQQLRTLQIKLSQPLDQAQQQALPEHFADENKLLFTNVSSFAEARQLLQQLSQQSIDCTGFHYGGEDLESLFLQLTKHSLRD